MCGNFCKKITTHLVYINFHFFYLLNSSKIYLGNFLFTLQLELCPVGTYK